MYTPEQVDESRLYALRLEARSLAAHSQHVPCRRFAEQVAPILDAYAATLKAAQGGVTDAMVERAAAAIKDIANPRFVGEMACVGFAEAALEAALSAQQGQGEFTMLCGTCRITGPRADVLHISRIIGEPDETASPAQPADSKVIGDDSQIKPERVPEGWAKAYAAFKGAFDTPAAWRRDSSDYAEDARRRMRELNERLTTSPSPAPSPARGDGGEG